MARRWTDHEVMFLKECYNNSCRVLDACELFRTSYPNRFAKAIASKAKDIGLLPGKEQPPEAPVADEIKEAKVEVSLNAQLNKKIAFLRSEVARLTEQEVGAATLLKHIHGYEGAVFNTRPDWLTIVNPAPVTGIPVLFLSDIHFDEVVYKNQVEGANEYNHAIAVKRLEHTFKTAWELCLKFMHEPSYGGIVLALGGDLLSGNIHEELAETNESPILKSALDLCEILYQGIHALADKFGRVFIPCVVGNHGRLHHKPRAKNRVMDNYEWVIYQTLAQRFSKDPRVTFAIAESSDITFKVYNKVFLLTHGDQFKGGTGISGIFSPLFIGQARKQKRQIAIKKPFDVMMIGHWHQYIHTEGLIINGSVKGMDEYAYQGNFGFERPQQALFIVHPEFGITYRMPVLCDSYEKRDMSYTQSLEVWGAK